MANSNFIVHNGLTVGPVTIDAATDTAYVGDTATAVLTHSFAHTLSAFESMTVKYSCSAPTGGSPKTTPDGYLPGYNEYVDALLNCTGGKNPPKLPATGVARAWNP